MKKNLKLIKLNKYELSVLSEFLDFKTKYLLSKISKKYQFYYKFDKISGDVWNILIDKA